MVEGDFAPGGPAKYQVKGTTTALARAADLGLTLPVLRHTDRLFGALVSHGSANLDRSAVLLELRRLNGDHAALPPV